MAGENAGQNKNTGAAPATARRPATAPNPQVRPTAGPARPTSGRTGAPPATPPSALPAIAPKSFPHSAAVKAMVNTARPAQSVRIAAQPTATPPARRNLAAGSTTVTPAVVMAVQRINCSRCNASINPSAQIEKINGKAVCVECQHFAAKKKVEVKINPDVIRGLAAGTAVFMALAAIFFPPQALFVGGLLSIAATLCGLLGFTLNGRLRLALTSIGIVAALFSFWGISQVHAIRAASRTAQEFSTELSEIHTLLDTNNFAQAQQRIATVECKALAAPGRYISAEAESCVKQAHALRGDWMKKHFGSLDLNTFESIATFLMAHPLLNTIGNKYLRAISREGGHCSITIALDCGAPVAAKSLPCSESAVMECAGVLNFAFHNLGQVDSLILELLDATSERSVGRFTVSQIQASTLNQNPTVQDILALFKAN
jgi:hypothetical protein